MLVLLATGICTVPVFKRKTEGSVHLHVVRRAGRRQRSDLLQLRPAQSRPVGIRSGAAQPRQRSRLRPIVTGGTIILYVLSLILSRQGMQIMVQPSSADPVSCSARAAPFRSSEGRWWTVLTAGWLHGGILHIFFNVMWIRQLGPEIAKLYGAGPDGDHLHRRRHRRLRAQQRSSACSRFRFFGARPDRRRFGLDLRLPRRAGALRQPDRQQPRPRSGPAVRALHGHHGIRDAAAWTTPRTLAGSSAATWRRWSWIR